jgi:hypothetical protein
MATKVDLIDPIDSVSRLPQDLNGTPPYENMFIFAELTAIRRGRSVITVTAAGNTTLRTDNTIKVNFSGFDQDTQQHTTKWTQNVGSNNRPNYEGFGMTNISVNVSSSFVPEVEIEFVDIRGLSFLNQGENSPYSILFDFPPPIFQLTIKGYYGRPLKYDLHLTENNTSFESETGFYKISSKFIARTFAPLTDILFQYPIIAPYMNIGTIEATADAPNFSSTENPNSINPNPRVPPKNTRELLRTLESLNDRLTDFKENSTVVQNYRDNLERLDRFIEIENLLNRFRDRTNNAINNDVRRSLLIREPADIRPNIETDVSGNDEFTLIDTVSQYDEKLRQSNNEGAAKNNSIKLFLVVKTELPNGQVQQKTENRNRLLQLIQQLNVFQASFDENVSRNLINPIEETIQIPLSVINNESNEMGTLEYIGIDITEYYNQFHTRREQAQVNANNSFDRFIEIANDNIISILGFEPTIKNVFKIICDDIDRFFDILRETVEEAENHHERQRGVILGSNQVANNNPQNLDNNQDKKIFPFPTIVEEARIVSGGNEYTRQQRAYPDSEGLIGNTLRLNGDPFPETLFVDEYIRATIDIQRQNNILNLRRQTDETGNNKWIPINPLDAAIGNRNVDYNSPYLNLNRVGSADNSITEIFNRLANRIYILSQYSYNNLFYTNDTTGRNLRKFLAEAEAINIANSIDNDVIRQKLKNETAGGFFTEKIDSAIFNLSNSNEFVNIGGLPDNNPNSQVYIDRTNPNYRGFEILNNSIALRNNSNTDGSGNIVDQFMNNETNLDFFDNVSSFLGFTTDTFDGVEFSTENIPVYDTQEFDGASTDFLDAFGSFVPIGIRNENTYINTIADVLANDRETAILNVAQNSNISNVPFFVWLTAGFGYTKSFFDTKFFNFANIVNVPKFAILYMGGLVKLFNDPTLAEQYRLIYQNDDIINNEKIFPSIDGFEDDLTNIGNISVNDRVELERYFDTNVNINNINIATIRNLLIEIIQDVEQLLDSQNSGISSLFSVSNFIDQFFGLRFNAYKSIFRANVSDIRNETIVTGLTSIIREGDPQNFKRFLIDEFNQTVSVVNYSRITFSTDENLPTQYTSFSSQIANQTEINQQFINRIFSVLNQRIGTIEEENKEREAAFTATFEDEDIKNSLYYTFKAINDKWLAGENNGVGGFPLNTPESDTLIDKFAFVDRAFNDIGDASIISLDTLIDAENDFDINIFNLFSRILSTNNYEFFPLANFMLFNERTANFADAFRIFNDVSNDQIAPPAFICMYIGGTSSVLDIPNSPFENDTILGDLDQTDIPDFQAEGNENTNVTNKFARVNAFRVRFAEQNQSFFTKIELDQREHPETNESLAILSKIAQDESKSSPVPKAQNLYNVYENRSYSATVTMLGNGMIQPTQYFQLENVPLFNGPYMILEVNHQITPNHMVTKFNGVRILRFPVPFVTDPLSIIGTLANVLQIENPRDRETGNPIGSGIEFTKAMQGDDTTFLRLNP